MRRGSIPLAFAIAGVLAALAFSVQFMTSNSARLEKTIELHEIAERLATAALEEVLTKMSNNMADTVIADNPGDKVFFRPLITRLLADKTLPGTQIPPVYVQGRLVDKPNNPADRQKFLDLLTAAVAFGGVNHKDGWQETPSLAKDWMKLKEQDASGAWVDAAWVQNMLHDATPRAGAAHEYYTTFNRAKYLNRNDAIRQAFNDVPVLRPLPWVEKVFIAPDKSEHQAETVWVDPVTKQEYLTDPTVGPSPTNASAVKVVSTPVVRQAGDQSVDEVDRNVHTQAEIDQFSAKWNVAMNRIADQVNTRIGNCGGNPNYGVGAEVAAFALGAAADADATEEEEFRESAQNGGLLEYRSSLLTLQAECWINTGALNVQRQAMCQRMVQQIDLSPAMNTLRNRILTYLMYTYNMTPRDFMKTRTATGDSTPFGEPIFDGKRVKLIGAAKTMFMDLFKRFPDSPAPKIFPFTVANCSGKARM